MFSRITRSLLGRRLLSTLGATAASTTVRRNEYGVRQRVTVEVEGGRVLDGVEESEEDIFPDPVSASLAKSWRTLATDVHELRRSWQKK